MHTLHWHAPIHLDGRAARLYAVPCAGSRTHAISITKFMPLSDRTFSLLVYVMPMRSPGNAHYICYLAEWLKSQLLRSKIQNNFRTRGTAGVARRGENITQSMLNHSR